MPKQPTQKTKTAQMHCVNHSALAEKGTKIETIAN